MATHASVLPWRIHGQRSLAGYRPWGHRQSDTAEATYHAFTERLKTANAKTKKSTLNSSLSVKSRGCGAL